MSRQVFTPTEYIKMIILKRLASVSVVMPIVAIGLLSNTAQASVHPYSATEVTQVTLDTTISRQILAPMRSRIDQWSMSGAPAGSEKTSGLELDLQSGLSAGDNAQGISGWASFTSGNIKDDTAGLDYDSDTRSYSVGFDSQVNKNVLAGLSLSYSNTTVDSAFNNGESDGDTYTLAPYIAYKIDDTFTIDGSFGYSWAKTDLERNNGAVTGTQDGNSYFFTMNAKASHWYDNLNVSGRVGYLGLHSDQDGFTESDSTVVASSNNDLGQLQLNATVAYYTENVMPYFSVTYENDLISTEVVGATNDEDGLVYNIGASFYNSGAISGGISYSLVNGRDNIENDSISANIAMQF